MARTSISKSSNASAELQHETGSLEQFPANYSSKLFAHSCTDSAFDDTLDTSATAERCTESAAEFESDATTVPAAANNDDEPSGSDVQ